MITLAIIGIVAVLTIPTLITKNQEKVWNTAANIFELKLEESLKIMNTQGVLAGYNSTTTFINELSKHLKITKICNNNELTNCVSNKIFWNVIDANTETTVTEIDTSTLKTSADLGKDDWNTETVGFQLLNGTNGIISYNPKCKQDSYNNLITGLDCISIIYDTTGNTNPNTFNKDLRGINTKFNNCALKIGSTCYGTVFKPSYLTYEECEAQKDSLGIKNCCPDEICHGKDYWAGAVAHCGHISKLPSREQLGEVANFVFNTTGLGPDVAANNLNLNVSRAEFLGFKLVDDAYFYIWAGKEHNAQCAYRENIDKTSAHGNIVSRYGSNGSTMCLGN